MLMDNRRAYLYAEKNLKMHLRGRQHRVNLDRSQSAERSVYVRGFPNTLSKPELVEFFGKFGTVCNAWMPVNGVSWWKHIIVGYGNGYCSNLSQVYAIVEFADEAVAEAVLHVSKPLYLGGKKLTVKPRDIKLHTKSSKSDVQYKANTDELPNVQPPKSKEHRHGDAGPEGEQLKFDPEVMQQISAADSVGLVFMVVWSVVDSLCCLSRWMTSSS